AYPCHQLSYLASLCCFSKSLKIINPITLVRSIKIKKIFNQLKYTPKNNISATTVPPAPNPTITVYTVVVGSIYETLIIKTLLTIIKTTVSVHVKKIYK